MTATARVPMTIVPPAGRRQAVSRPDGRHRIDTMCGGCGRRFSIDRSVLLAGEPQPCPHCGDLNADEPTHPKYIQPATL